MENSQELSAGYRHGGIMNEAPDRDTLGGRLSRAREASGISTAQLARRIGVKTVTLQSWECDRSEPRANRLTILAGILNVSLSWLLYGVGEAPNDDARSEMIRLVDGQLEQMRNLRDKTSAIIERLEAERERFEA